jgi:hypothetical protein
LEATLGCAVYMNPTYSNTITFAIKSKRANKEYLLQLKRPLSHMLSLLQLGTQLVGMFLVPLLKLAR